ncbi:MAG TPA: PAS domain S-box protein [Coleofasciculaceae cyanobacterium]
MSIFRFPVAVAGKVPLRTVLIVPFVLQIVGMVGLVGYLSWRNGQQAVNEVAAQLRIEISDRTSERISTYLKTPHLINSTNADAIRLGQLDIKNPQTLERHFLKQIQVFNSLSKIYFSNPQGGFISIGNDERGLTVASTENFVRGVLRVYSVDNQGNRQKLLVNSQNYDARKRPFYTSAVEAGKPTWSPIYVYVPSSRGLGIAANYPFYDETGKFQCVLSSDLSLVAINNFLRSLKIGTHGEAFIIERSGMIVASSSPETSFVNSAQTNDNKRVSFTEIKNPLIRATALNLTSKLGKLTNINDPRQVDFNLEGKRQFAQVTPFKDKFGLDWLIVVVVPEADFMKEINANTNTTILLCLAAFIVATGMGIFSTRWITKPLLQLNTAAKKITQGEWDTTIELQRSDEVGQLAASFNQMTVQLQASFAALRESESRLTQFLEALPVGVSVHEVTGKLTYANPISKQLLGITTLPDAKTEQLAQAYRVYLSGTEQLYPVEQMPVVKALSGESSTVEDMELHHSDRIIPLEVRATPIYDESGKIVSAIATFTDITQRRQSQKLLDDYNRTLENQVSRRTAALQDSEKRFRTSVETMLDCFGIYSAIRDESGKIIDFRIEYVNEAVCITNQTPKEQQIGKMLCELLPNHRSSGLFDEYVNVVETGNPLIKEELIYEDVFNQQRLTRAFDIRAAKLGDGFTAAWRDVTDKKRAEEELRQREQEFRALVENAPDVISRVDRDYRFCYVNPRVEVETGIPAREWIGKTELDLGLPEAIVNPWHEALERVFATGQEEFYEAEFPSAEGIKYWSCRLLPELDEQGSVETVLNIGRDISDRKQIEKQLQLQSAAMAVATDGIAIINPNGEYVYLNEAHVKIFGYDSVDELLGKNWSMLYDEAELQRIADEAVPLLLQQGYCRLEARGLRRDGTTFPHEVSVTLLESGERICIVRDITERKQAEETLRESQHFIQRVADASPNLWYIYDLIEQRNVYANREIAAVLGYTSQEIQAMGSAILPTILHPDDLTKSLEHLERFQSASDEDILEIEYRMREANGGWRTLLCREIVFSRTPDGRVKQLLGTATDITQLKKTQDLLESIFNESTDAIFLVNPETGLIIDCNQTAVELFEATRKDDLLNIDGSTLQQTPFTPEELTSILDEIDRYGFWCRELEYVTKKGKPFWGNLAAKPIQVAGQRINLARVTDITDVKQTEVQLQQAKEAADAANRTNSQFLANMSHELRTPLNAILGFSQLMSKSSNLAPEDKENLTIILRSGEHLLTLINQVLDLSKIEMGRITLHETAFDLFHLLDDLETMFQLKANNKKLQLVFERSSDVPQYVKTDEVKLRQVLINLLSNAIKFTKEGNVSVRVSAVSNKKQRTMDNRQLTIHFEIEDTGVGIAPEELESIFDAFVQGKKGRQLWEGTGLGLSISRKFVQLMGEQITVSSVVDKGSTFKFDIPVSVVEPNAIAIEQPTRQVIALEPNQPRYRILIVDDKPDNRQLLIQLLSPLGFELREVSNGREAIEVWESWQPHLIFMDLRMPVMDGFEATQQIRKRHNSLVPKIIALSAGNLEEKRTAALEVGCDAFIHKPFTEADIFKMMSKHIRVRFVYDEPAVASDINQTQANILNPDALDRLPAEWLASLHQATFEGDLEKMLALIEQIRDQPLVGAEVNCNEQLTNALISLANNLQYRELLNLTQPRDS